MRYIVALAWVYVVLMMSFAEQSAVAGVMTFLLYAVLPWMIILYVMGSPKRRRARHEAEKFRAAAAMSATPTEDNGNDAPAEK
jgi:ABC-type transport system involved in cytochrome bd biosynthesis fused ATPase/permease subunit